MRRTAVTLLEVLIAVSIFGLVMGSVIGCLTSMRSFAGGEGATNDLNIEGQRVLSSVVGDMSNSAWLVDPSAEATLISPSLDRSLRYYPFVLVQASTGVATTTHLADWTRTVAQVPNWTGSIYVNQIPSSHQLQSQEVIFVKVQRSAPSAQPLTYSDHVNFNADWTGTRLGSGVLWPAGVLPMSNFRTGVTVDSVITAYDTGGKTVTDTPLVFETYAGSSNLTPGGGNDLSLVRNIADGLREYAYIVMPDSATHKNMLVRCWRDGTSVTPIYPPATPTASAGYTIVSEYVDRLVVDTYRTLSSLDINQMRIRLYLSKDSVDPGSNPVLSTTVECTCALRSTVDPNYSLNLGSWLGPAGTMHAYLNTEQSGGVH
jgi:hypothetical protein